jgi:hypothetical protein
MPETIVQSIMDIVKSVSAFSFFAEKEQQVAIILAEPMKLAGAKILRNRFIPIKDKLTENWFIKDDITLLSDYGLEITITNHRNTSGLIGILTVISNLEDNGHYGYFGLRALLRALSYATYVTVE